jgi:hypothetical protein
LPGKTEYSSLTQPASSSMPWINIITETYQFVHLVSIQIIYMHIEKNGCASLEKKITFVGTITFAKRGPWKHGSTKNLA